MPSKREGFGELSFSSASPKRLCSTAGLCASGLSSPGCGDYRQGLQDWEVEEVVVASGPGTALPFGLCCCLAQFLCSSMVLEYLESLFAVVWDAFASLEHLGVSSSSAATQGSANLLPVGG